MKYMGHKAQHLEAIHNAIEEAAVGEVAVGDLFCGTAVVANSIAANTHRRVIATDVQRFATIRAKAVLNRKSSISADRVHSAWVRRAYELAERGAAFSANASRCALWRAPDVEIRPGQIKWARSISERAAQELRALPEMKWPMLSAYGGHYYSPRQAFILDCFRNTVSRNNVVKYSALASIIEAASRCCAAPGHTAQPFSYFGEGGKYLLEAWDRNPERYIEIALRGISGLYANRRGLVVEGGYQAAIRRLSEGDVAFVDPPYSAVQYSRFYHVLETLVRQTHFDPIGVGRYPPRDLRPSSAFSTRSGARQEAEKLIRLCGERNISLVITYPDAQTSTGLSARCWRQLAESWYRNVNQRLLNGRMSSLGGNGINRSSRSGVREALIVCTP